jgi:hypothetical protein
MANTPTYITYHVKDTTAGENGEKRGVWTRVGAAWSNKDGKGFNVVLDMINTRAEGHYQFGVYV